jgi:hypothetical protein
MYGLRFLSGIVIVFTVLSANEHAEHDSPHIQEDRIRYEHVPAAEWSQSATASASFHVLPLVPSSFFGSKRW